MCVCACVRACGCVCVCASTEKDAAVDIAKSGILPTLAQALRNNNQLSQQVALVVAEVAREGEPLWGMRLGPSHWAVY